MKPSKANVKAHLGKIREIICCLAVYLTGNLSW